jgi:NAD(P)-dependent dehydrogenase (short-subunit alcohol dehydrogenase family)
MGLSETEVAELKDTETAGIPLGSRGRPEDIAAWVAALARPDSWVTGQVIRIDGGYSLG